MRLILALLVITVGIALASAFRCPPGVTSYFDGCNTVGCDRRTGRITWSTRRYCSPLKQQPLSDKFKIKPAKRCPFGVSFKRDCNSCGCDPATGRTMCTMRACPPKFLSENPSAAAKVLKKFKKRLKNRGCPFGTSFYDGCNSCSCNPATGSTMCTRRACLPRILAEKFAVKSFKKLLGKSENCPNGTVFKRDCNTCYCDPATGSTMCTKIGCVAKSGKTLSDSARSIRRGYRTSWCPKGAACTPTWAIPKH